MQRMPRDQAEKILRKREKRKKDAKELRLLEGRERRQKRPASANTLQLKRGGARGEIRQRVVDDAKIKHGKVRACAQDSRG